MPGRLPIRYATLAILGLVLPCGSPAHSEIRFQDEVYWTPTGTVVNPATPPDGAWLRIEETVYDDTQGRQVLADGFASDAIHGSSVPEGRFDLYVFSIGNLSYGNGPFTHQGAGIGAFHVPIPLLPGPIPMGVWGPTAAVDHWETINAFDTGSFGWVIDGNTDGVRGDGTGIALGQSFNGFMFAVDEGAKRQFSEFWFPSSVHTWTGAGILDEMTGAVPADVIQGHLLIPVPEPSTFAMLLLGTLAFLATAAERSSCTQDDRYRPVS